MNPIGILGVTDNVFQGLNMQTPERVALFIRNARNNQYSLAALKKGAAALGVQHVGHAVLHIAVVGAIMDHVVRGYSNQVDVDSQPHINAVGAALGLNGNPLTRQDIYANINAMYGIIAPPVIPMINDDN